MTREAEAVLAQALQLAETDRGELAARLLESLEPTDEGVDEAWDREIQARIDDIRSGRETPIPWAEARKQIMADDDGDAR